MKTVFLSILLVLMSAKSSNFIFPEDVLPIKPLTIQPSIPTTMPAYDLNYNTLKLDILNLQLKIEILEELLELHDKLFHKIPEFKKEDRQRT